MQRHFAGTRSPINSVNGRIGQGEQAVFDQGPADINAKQISFGRGMTQAHGSLAVVYLHPGVLRLR